MKARPILFSAPMVRSILESRKTQTRRALAVQPPAPNWELATLYDTTCRETKKHIGKKYWIRRSSEYHIAEESDNFFRNPYGQPGSLLWVRESCALWMNRDGQFSEESDMTAYKATESDTEWENLKSDSKTLKELNSDRHERLSGGWVIRSPIHMPRWASRITLEITNIRVERLQDISEEDAVAEGAKYLPEPIFMDKNNLPNSWSAEDLDSARFEFATLWQSINGHGSWEYNPWVWVIEFKPIIKNVDLVLEASA